MRNSKGPSADPMERLFACFLGIILKYWISLNVVLLNSKMRPSHYNLWNFLHILTDTRRIDSPYQKIYVFHGSYKDVD